MAITTCIFDAYGTLFDVSAAARRAAEEPGREALAERLEHFSEAWRRKQMDYTWLRTAARRHADFWQVTQDALDWALEDSGLTDPELRERLLALYRELDAYPEVPAMLTALQEKGMALGILSNGTPEMLRSAVEAAGVSERFDAVLSVEEVGVFKPDLRVYDLVEAHFICDAEEVLFVSANGWDAASAAAYGFVSAWVNRAGAPAERLWAEPHHVLPNLDGLAGLV